MKKYIDEVFQDIISDEFHSKICNCKNFVEVTKLDSNKGILTVEYKHCPKCNKYITGNKYNLSVEHY